MICVIPVKIISYYVCTHKPEYNRECFSVLYGEAKNYRVYDDIYWVKISIERRVYFHKTTIPTSQNRYIPRDAWANVCQVILNSKFLFVCFALIHAYIQTWTVCSVHINIYNYDFKSQIIATYKWSYAYAS